jgi:hypothetical protein
LETVLADLYELGDIVGARPLRVNWMELPLAGRSLEEEEAMATIQSYRDLWWQKEIHQQLMASLTCHAPTKVIGFACRSLWSEDNRTSLFQHAAVYAIAQALNIKGYCQDPDYLTEDKKLLDKLDISVLENPDGFLEVDESSIVLSIFPAAPVKQIIADDRDYWPMGMIWIRSESVEEERALLKSEEIQ